MSWRPEAVAQFMEHKAVCPHANLRLSAFRWRPSDPRSWCTKCGKLLPRMKTADVRP